MMQFPSQKMFKKKRINFRTILHVKNTQSRVLEIHEFGENPT